MISSFRLRKPLVLFSLAAALLADQGAEAGVMFDFNALGAGINATNSTSSPDSIDQYMTSEYGSSVTVARGARTRRYNIEPYPTYFLGNTDGATHASDASNYHPSSSDFDTYLHNRWNSWLPSDVRDRIVITFADVPIYELEVDWQIFPVTQYGADADLTIKADGTTIFYHGLVGAAKEDGDLGHLSYAFDQPVSTLEFIDWRDAPIGIDNLWVGNTPPDEQMEAVPEPATLGLWAFGLAIGVVVSSRRRSGRS